MNRGRTGDVEMKTDDRNYQQELKTEIRPYNEKGYTQNLVIVKNNSVEVYIIDGEDYYAYHTFDIYARIWNCLKIPI